MVCKFKVGDLVQRNNKNPNVSYNFGGTVGIIKEGDIVEISTVSEEHHILYSVKGAYIKRPNWLSMEENFDFAKVTNWKKRIK